jgi:hypothetical protein
LITTKKESYNVSEKLSSNGEKGHDCDAQKDHGELYQRL